MTVLWSVPDPVKGHAGGARAGGVAPSMAVHLLCGTSAAGRPCSHGPILTPSPMVLFCFHHILFEMKGSKGSPGHCSGALLRGPLTTVQVRCAPRARPRHWESAPPALYLRCLRLKLPLPTCRQTHFLSLIAPLLGRGHGNKSTLVCLGFVVLFLWLPVLESAFRA